MGYLNQHIPVKSFLYQEAANNEISHVNVISKRKTLMRAMLTYLVDSGSGHFVWKEFSMHLINLLMR